jgi:hypothetical protein
VLTVQSALFVGRWQRRLRDAEQERAAVYHYAATASWPAEVRTDICASRSPQIRPQL